MLRPVILSGGLGTRLWPLSTSVMPKQFLPLVGEDPMIVATERRLEGLDAGVPIVVCNAAHASLIAAELPHAEVILEPVGRNTAPAIAAAALAAEPPDVLLVLPSDHHIDDAEPFRDAVRKGELAAEGGALVTFGIVPNRPATGYGYIRPGEPFGDGRLVDAFVEKPDADTATAYVEEGYLWNSGMFMFTAERFLEELAIHRPAIDTAVRAAFSEGRLDADLFAAVPAESVDYAVMEETDRAVVLPLDVGWSDIGSWDTLADRAVTDDTGTTLFGDVIADDIEGSYIRTTGPTVAISGVDDLIVVATPDAVLILPRGGSDAVTKLRDQVREGRK